MAPRYTWRNFLPPDIEVDQVYVDRNTIQIHSRSAKIDAVCPHCDTISRHVHSSYHRRPCDLPAHGRTVEFVLLVRRFWCENPQTTKSGTNHLT